MNNYEPLVVETEELLRDIDYILKKRGREILQDFDITPPQFSALLNLYEYGNLTMGNLCDKMGLACSTVTDLIDRMEKNDLVERERDKIDRRVTRLKVKEKGSKIIEQVMHVRRLYLEGILKNIDMGEKEKLVKSLKQISDLMHS